MDQTVHALQQSGANSDCYLFRYMFYCDCEGRRTCFTSGLDSTHILEPLYLPIFLFRWTRCLAKSTTV